MNSFATLRGCMENHETTQKRLDPTIYKTWNESIQVIINWDKQFE